MKRLSRCLLSICFLCASFAEAERPDLQSEINDLKSSLSSLSSLLKTQQGRIERLEAENASLKRVEGGTPVSTAPAPRNKSQYLPDVGLVVDAVASSTEQKSDEEGNDRLSVREVELIVGHDVDPYSRLDAVLTFSDFESPDIEEAVISYWDLPWDTKARIGRMRPKIGKASAIHRDSLETVDEPLVVQRYLGVEGLFRTGVELTGFSPLSEENFAQELSFGVMQGGSGEGGLLFGETGRRPTFYSHVKNYYDLTDVSSIELGGTYLLGSSDEDSKNEVNAFGVDLTYQHFVTPRNKLKLQAESYFQRRADSFAVSEEGERTDFRGSPWGMYALADYRFTERWGGGVRYDWVQPVDAAIDAGRDADEAYTAYLTFFQSEFARWRVQYQLAHPQEGGEDNRFFLQGTFSIGKHSHQLQ